VSKTRIRLTEYSHGAGCGCKISPQVLSEILSEVRSQERDPRLLVGYDTRDDAAVYQISDDQAIVSTTDFFMPIVDDPIQFGAIAAVNAISDVYAMGGRPVMAISILGWPVGKLDASLAGQVVEGARQSCARARVVLAGGHSIDAPEPIFGLAVTGLVHPSRVRSNDRARVGDELYLTKPLGVGILTTAEKRGLLRSEDRGEVIDLMLGLNDIGPALGKLDAIGALTDVTGFGLIGHLIELCEASHVAAEVDFADVPKLGCLPRYLAEQTIPGGTDRNYRSYGHKVSEMSDTERAVLCDPQTSGGLLVSVDPRRRGDFERVTRAGGLELRPFGRLLEERPDPIRVTVRSQPDSARPFPG
jgi:selenide,water dikinase